MDKMYVAREDVKAVQDVSEREMEVLLLIARGMIPREIARSLAISEKTVRNHIGSIYRKIGIYDRAQVVVYAVKKGLIDLSREEPCPPPLPKNPTLKPGPPPGAGGWKASPLLKPLKASIASWA